MASVCIPNSSREQYENVLHSQLFKLCEQSPYILIEAVDSKVFVISNSIPGSQAWLSLLIGSIEKTEITLRVLRVRVCTVAYQTRERGPDAHISDMAFCDRQQAFLMVIQCRSSNGTNNLCD